MDRLLMNRLRRLPPGAGSVALLFGVQAVSNTGHVMVFTLAGLAGAAITPNPVYATLPISALFVTLMVGTILAAATMRKLGRRYGFIAGQVTGVVASLVMAYAMVLEDFVLFLVGAALTGVHAAFFNLIRFAAAEVVPDAWRNRAMSAVFVGGIVAAFAGPRLAVVTQGLVPGHLFAGCFASIAVILLINIALMLFVRFPDREGLSPEPEAQTEHAPADAPRPLTQVIRAPDFLLAVVAGALGYGTMNFVMTATPLAMHHHGFDLAATAQVMQWHVLAMFAPSFFTGTLIDRLGARRIIVLGVMFNLLCAAVNSADMTLTGTIIALAALGVGWNFMFVGASSLLTGTYRRSEREKVQGLNDFLVFSSVAASSFASGYVHATMGWQAINTMLTVAMVALGAAALVAHGHRRVRDRRRARSAG